ncbi:major cell surface glycoprotein (TIGR04216 family), partial [Haloplanus aerogenes]
MTDYNDKARAVILAALMVFSVFAGTVALSGTAAADYGGDSGATATDVPTGDPGFDQTVTFTSVTGGADGTDTITLTYSGVSGVSANSVESAAFQGSSGFSVNNTTVTGGGDVEIGINTSASGSEDLEIVVNVDASGASTGPRTLAATAAVGSAPTDPGFDVTASAGGSDNRGDGAGGDFNTADGTGVIYPGATVFQGESGLELGGTLSGGIVKTAGDAEGVPLEVPDVPQDQATGRYTTDGASGSDGVTVQRPRVTTLDVENAQGADIAGGSVPQGDDNEGSGELTVVGSWNYEDAEDLEVTVENDDGLDVTGDAITGNDDPGGTSDPATRTASDVGQMGAGSNEVNWDLDLSDLNTGTFTITLAGTDDLDFGEASQSTTVTVTGDDDVSLDLDSSRVTRGEDVTFRIRGSNAGDFHV